MAEANINPIPIHIPSGFGGANDLMVIVNQEIQSFRQWVGGYKKELRDANVFLGQPEYVTQGGVTCFNDLMNVNGWTCLLDPTDPSENEVAEFLSVIGFTDEEFIDLCDLWNERGEYDGARIEQINFRWLPQFAYMEGDFNFWKDYIQQALTGLTIKVTHKMYSYDDVLYPTEPDRPAISMTDADYNLSKDYEYSENIGTVSPYRNFDLTGRFIYTGKLYINAYIPKFYDEFGAEVIVEPYVYDGVRAFLSVSLTEAIDSISLVKQPEDLVPIYPGIVEITSIEEIEIRFQDITYDRYYLGDEESEYVGTSTSGSYYGEYFPYYLNLLWRHRSEVLTPSDPLNDEIGMFIPGDTGWYYLRKDFEHFASPDEIAYLLSRFSYIEVVEEEVEHKFLAGIIKLSLFVLGAALFYFGFVNAAKYMWKMVIWVSVRVTKNLIQQEAQAIYDETQATLQATAELQYEEAMEQAARDNKTDVSYTYDYYDKLEPINPFDSGLFNPLSRSSSASNPFTVGGEYYSPHKKLANQRDIL